MASVEGPIRMVPKRRIAGSPQEFLPSESIGQSVPHTMGNFLGAGRYVDNHP